jgi:predicted O-methyltransferase YrrM
MNVDLDIPSSPERYQLVTATFVDEHLLRIGAADFHCALGYGVVPPGRLEVMKPPDLVNRYIELCSALEPKRVFELGIHRGGSTAMISELTQPEKLVAVELDTDPVELLERYIGDRQLAEVVRPYYGVNQADRERLAEIVADEFGDSPIDLVVDDASHLYEETRSSFESLFPHLRPGGVFVIEDWRWQHAFSDRFTKELLEDSPEAEKLRAALESRIAERELLQEKAPVPLSRLALELLLARASDDDVVRELTVGPYWVVARRGEAPLDAVTFRVSDLYHDHFGLLAPS